MRLALGSAASRLLLVRVVLGRVAVRASGMALVARAGAVGAIGRGHTAIGRWAHRLEGDGWMTAIPAYLEFHQLRNWQVAGIWHNGQSLVEKAVGVAFLVRWGEDAAETFG